MRQELVLDIAVEFPEEGETVASPQFDFRVWAADARSVCVSIDGGPWLGCRPEGGYWWREWSGYSNGRHWVAARMRDAEGRYVLGRPQRFQVELPETELTAALESCAGPMYHERGDWEGARANEL